MMAMHGGTEPRIERSIRLELQGDWGQANLHRVCGWLSQQVWNRAGPATRIAIWNGRGGVDNVSAAGRGHVDIAIPTPATFVPMARDGRGPYGAEPFPDLRALGTVAQWDRLVFAVHANTGIRTFQDLAEKAVPLRIATCVDDGINHIGMAVQRIMELEGIPRSQLESWGGTYVEFESPHDCFSAVREGTADALFQEAIMTPGWQSVADDVDLNFVSIDQSVLDELTASYGWQAAELPADYFRGQDAAVTALDFSDFLVLTRSDLPEDIAYLVAWCLVETREQLERQYRHIPAERSPMTYPLVPTKIATTTIPLHPGAERYYRSAGLIR